MTTDQVDDHLEQWFSVMVRGDGPTTHARERAQRPPLSLRVGTT
jgi:hypothetical protein